MRAALALLLAAWPAVAQHATVALPALPPDLDPAPLLADLVAASVAGANCPGQADTGTSLLINGTLDLTAARMALDPAALDALFTETLSALDAPGFCDAARSATPDLVKRLRGWGGSSALISG